MPPSHSVEQTELDEQMTPGRLNRKIASLKHDPELEGLDRKLDHLSASVLPSSPYLLKLHSERPYNLSPHQTTDLVRYTPFNAGEEQLQYTTFSAAKWEDTLINPIGGWEDDKLDDTSNSSRSQKMQSAGGTPSIAPKKISITEYRKRATGQSGPVASPKLNGAARVAETERKDQVPVPTKVTGPLPAQGGKNLKRPAPNQDGALFIALSQEKGVEIQPSKKARTSPKLDGRQAPESVSSNKLSLPEPISPTLPPLFEKRLAELDSPKVNVADHSKHEDRSKASNAAKPGSSAEKSKFYALKDLQSGQVMFPGLERLRKDTNDRIGKIVVDLSTSPNGARDSKAQQPDRPTRALKQPSEKTSELSEARPPVEIKRRSQIIRLKIPRPIRKTVQRILQLKPQPRSDGFLQSKTTNEAIRFGSSSTDRYKEDFSSAKIREEIRSSRARAESSATDSSSRAGDRKQRRGNELDPAYAQHKRQKSAESRTPQAFKSPVLTGRSGNKKPRESTPSISIVDETVSTPQGSIRNGTPAAPSSVERSSKEARHTPSTSGTSHSTTSEAYESLRQQREKYFELGRTLKKESDQMLKVIRDSERQSSTAMKKCIVVRLEVALSFALAYLIGDEIRRKHRQPLNNPQATWSTLFPWLQLLNQQMIPHPFLRGFSRQLEAVCHTVVWQLESEQAAASGFKEPDTARNLKKHYDDIQRMFVEGSGLLSVDDLQQEFPKTWRSKAHAPLASSPPNLTGSTLGGDFYLPITNITLPIEAVRAGKSLLSEWCKMEGVDCTPRFNI